MTKEQIDNIIAEENFEIFKWIDPKIIVVAQWVRIKCLFGCDGLGLGTCPPNTPSVKDCKQFFKEYKRAIVFQIPKYADKNAYPSEWSGKMTDSLLRIERELFLNGYYKTFLLNQTCCTLCKKCHGNRVDCKDKLRSRPSPEGFAVDVYQTVRNAGIEINVVSNNPSEINRIALLMVD